jgi:hypothetical protein
MIDGTSASLGLEQLGSHPSQEWAQVGSGLDLGISNFRRKLVGLIQVAIVMVQTNLAILLLDLLTQKCFQTVDRLL